MWGQLPTPSGKDGSQAAAGDDAVSRCHSAAEEVSGSRGFSPSCATKKSGSSVQSDGL